MKEIIERGAASQIVHVFIPDSASSTGAGKTGLTFNSAGLKIVVMRPGEASPTKYLQSAGNIEDITTIGTYAAPTANKCRFREIDATDLPGWYETHFADALFDTSNNRRSLGGMISGAAGVAPTPFQIQLSDPAKGVGSPSNVDATVSSRASQASVDTIDDYIDTEMAAALAAVDTEITTILSRLPAALVGGRMDASVGAMVADVITAAAIASAAITSAKFAAGAIDAAAVAPNAIDADALATDAVTEIQSGLSTLNAAGVRTAVGLASANLDTQLAPLAVVPYKTGTVDDAAATPGQFVGAAGLSASDDIYNGCLIVPTSGALQGVPRAVSDYVGATRTFTFTGAAGQADAPWPAALANGVAFIIIGRVE